MNTVYQIPQAGVGFPPPPPYSQYPKEVGSGGYVVSGGGTNIMMTAHPVPTMQTVVTSNPIRPANYMGLAIIVAIFFNPIFGVIAIALSLKSTSEYDNGNVEAARKHGRHSMILSICGMITGVIMTATLIWWAVSVLPGLRLRHYNGNACKYYSYQTSCNSKTHCIWRSYQCVDYCTSYYSSRDCNWADCAWSSFRGCQDTTTTRRYTTRAVTTTRPTYTCTNYYYRSACNAKGNCIWQVNDNRCVEFCRYFRTTSSCNSRSACVWKYNSCRDNIPICSNFHSRYSCSGIAACIWKNLRCINDCTKITSSPSCNTKANCEWNWSKAQCKNSSTISTTSSTTLTSAKASCNTRKNSFYCNRDPRCFWNSFASPAICEDLHPQSTTKRLVQSSTEMTSLKSTEKKSTTAASSFRITTDEIVPSTNVTSP